MYSLLGPMLREESYVGWFGRTVKPYKMSDDFNILFAQITKRKYWKELDAAALRRIFDNAHSDCLGHAKGSVGAIKDFIFVSEQNDLVKSNFLEIAQSHRGTTDWILFTFSYTLYRLGSSCVKAMPAARTRDEYAFYGCTSEMAFRSAILCNVCMLSAYLGMVTLLGTVHVDRTLGLEWCRRYKAAEDALRATPEDQLSINQRAAKKLLDPQEVERTHREMAEHLPGFAQRNCARGRMDMTNRQIVEYIERGLLEL